MEKLVEEIKKSNNGKVLGVFMKDNYIGPFVDSWKNVLKKNNFENEKTLMKIIHLKIKSNKIISLVERIFFFFLTIPF